jgi:hypothetical protein
MRGSGPCVYLGVMVRLGLHRPELRMDDGERPTPLPLQAERESLARELGREVTSRIMRAGAGGTVPEWNSGSPRPPADVGDSR